LHPFVTDFKKKNHNLKIILKQLQMRAASQKIYFFGGERKYV